MSRPMLAVVTACSATVILAAAAPQPGPAGKGDTKEKQTHSARELLDVARRGLELAETTPGSNDDYIWSKRVRDAELTLCGNTDERVTARERYLKRAARMEEIAKAAFVSGVGTKADVLEAEYHRCEAVMQLKAERSGSAPTRK